MSGYSVAATAALVVVFAVAIYGKTASSRRFRAFQDSLSQYGLRKRWTRRLVAFSAVTAEVGVLLVLIIAPLTGMPAVVHFAPAAILVSVFSLALVRGLQLGTGRVQCHCFGSDEDTDPRIHLGLNAALIALTLLAIVVPSNSHISDGVSVFSGGAGVLGGLVAVSLPFLIRLLRVDPPDDIRGVP